MKNERLGNNLAASLDVSVLVEETRNRRVLPEYECDCQKAGCHGEEIDKPVISDGEMPRQKRKCD